jgi:cell division protein FtsB
MRYWGTETKVNRRTQTRKTTQQAASTRPAKPKTARAGQSKVANGGSVQPFLRRFYRHQAVISGPIQRIALLLVLAGILYAFVLGDGGAIRIAMLRHQRGEVDQNIAELRHNVALLEKEIGRLENDAFSIEKLGRERYGYVRKGEQVYKIVPKDASQK